MSKKTIIIIVAVVALIALAAALTSVHSDKDDTDVTLSSVSTTETDTVNITESTVVNITPDTVCCTVYAPKHCTVLLEGIEVPYNESSDCYRIFAEMTGKHEVTVSKYGYKTVTKEINFDKEKYAELYVDLEVTEEYKKQAEKAAQDILLKFIEVCADGSGDLSGFNFVSEKDKSDAQKVVDGILNNLDIDTEDYKTGKINVSAIKCNGFDKSGNTLSHSNDIEGSVVTFTIEYNYTWEYNGENYQDSGVDSKTFNPFVKLENINGKWYLKTVYLDLKKDIH